MEEINLSFEPMDIDLSTHSSDNMDISVNDSNGGIDGLLRKINNSDMTTPTRARDEFTEILQSTPSDQCSPPYKMNIKKIHIKMQKDSSSANKIKVLCAALVLFLSMIAYQVLNIKCSDGINPDKLRNSLLNKLYGQTKAIDALVEGLIANEESKVLILYGSTGVGKTYAASILLEHVGSYSNVYHYTMPSFIDKFSTDFMFGLTVCKNTILIVDDLSPNDLDVKVLIKNLLTKSETLEKAVTVLLIYNNCKTISDFKRQCDENFPANIMDSFKQLKAYKKIIKFESLTEEHLRKCIKTELGAIKITDHELTKIMKSFDATIDGCKGVHMKMKLLDIS